MYNNGRIGDVMMIKFLWSILVTVVLSLLLIRNLDGLIDGTKVELKMIIYAIVIICCILVHVIMLINQIKQWIKPQNKGVE